MKGFSPAQHLRVCGVEDNGPIHAFAERLSALRRPMWLRYVLVPGLTDVRQEMEQLALFATGLSLAFGVMRLVNLAHGQLALVAAFMLLTFCGSFFWSYRHHASARSNTVAGALPSSKWRRHFHNRFSMATTFPHMHLNGRKQTRRKRK